jgi:phenylpropionate dioxygenase-like ring-hydroxylating dioxygenase large terminal subunit
MADLQKTTSGVDRFAPPREDEEAITVSRDWTPDEERRAKRK